MDPSRFSVVSLDLLPDDSTVLNLRVNDQWVHVEAQKSDLRNQKVRKQYETLVQNFQQQEQEDGSDCGDRPVATGTASRDSGYQSDGYTEIAKDTSEGAQEEDVKTDLHAWLLHALDSVFSDFLYGMLGQQHPSLAQWYNVQIHCYSVQVDVENEELNVLRRNDLNGEDYVRKHLTPHIELPKFLRGLKGVPWYRPEDLRVEDEADDIHLSAHPTQVSIPSELVPLDL